MPETTSILRGGIVFNEILVDPSGVNANFDTNGNGLFDDTDEFVELYNSSSSAIDISGLELWDANARNWYTLPGGSILESNSYAYIVTGNNSGTLPTPNTNTLVFDAQRSTGVFDNNQDNVVLFDPGTDEYIQFTYNFDTPDDPTTYAGFSASATRSGPIEDWKHDVDGTSIARTLFGSTRILKQDRILDTSAGQPTATPGQANSNGSENDDVIVGSNLDNVLTAGFGNDIVSGGDGNDQIWGNADEDTLNGGIGNDTLNGGLGADILNGDAGDDTLFGITGIDILNGGTGNDLLRGGNDNDSLDGGEGDDRLFGDRGDDTIKGGGTQLVETDTLFGGTGADTFILGEGDTVFYASEQTSNNRGLDNKAVIQDFQLGDNDVIQLSGYASDYYIESYANGTRSRLLLEKGEVDDIIALFSTDIVTQGANLASGTGFSFVTAPPQTLTGTSGADTLSGAGGADTISGEAGNDILSGANGADRIFGGAGNDVMNGGRGNDRLQGQTGNDTFNGGGLAAGERDIFIGNAGADTFILGTAEGVLYSVGEGNRGNQDRAIIVDFNLGQNDVLQLAGVATDYMLEIYSQGSFSRLVHVKDGADEIIASFNSNIATQGVDLAAGEGFSFV